MKLFDRRKPEQRFWDWFKENQSQIAAIERGNEPIIPELKKQLERVAKGLAWEKGRLPDGRYHFIVSADGIAEWYVPAKRLVEAAPTIPGWEITAFRPRKEMTEVVFEGVRTSLDDVAFIVVPSPDRGPLNVTFLVSEYDDPQLSRSRLGGLFILLDSLIGEEAAITKLGTMEFVPLEEGDGSELPLRELVALIDARS